MTDVAQSALDIILQALKDVGVLGLGQTADPEDINDAFLRLQWMMAQWQRKRWLVYKLDDFSVVSTGAQTYSVGPGGDFNISSRPDQLEASFLRQITQVGGGAGSLQVDYPMEIIKSREQYNDIALKGLTSFQSYVFYNPDYPLGTLFPYPIPDPSIYELHITLKTVLNPFTNLTQKAVIPPEYYAAMHFNLAVRLIETYGANAQTKTITLGLAKEALNVIRMASGRVPNLRMPLDLIRPGIYNPYSDQIR